MTRMDRETRGTSWLWATAMALVMLPSLVTASKAPSQLQARTPSKLQAMESYGRLPLSFEANNGQTESQVRFLARGRGYTLFLAENEAVFALRSAEVESVESVGSVPGKEQSSHLRAELSERTKRTQPTKQAVLRMRLEGANRSPMAHGVAPLPGVVNYFIGNDPTKWHTNIPTYGKVEYKNIYSSIDLVYYGNQGKLEYDFVVSPGADPNQIKLAFEGAENLRLADNGDLTLTVPGPDLHLQKPLVYQQDEKGRKQLVAGSYILLAADSPHVAIQVASYDRTRPLIIDPLLAYSTYLGGSGFDEGRAIAVDSNGNAYVTGTTDSADFPTLSAFQGALAGEGSQDAFVTKLNAAGSALVYSTYLGGSGLDEGRAIAVDADGNAYVTGSTLSSDFTTTPGAFQGARVNLTDAFVTKLNPAGSALVYSTYLGGFGNEEGRGIAVDNTTGSAYITGFTSSISSTLDPPFPTLAAVQPDYGGGSKDAFVTKLNSAGSALVYSTYLGGTNLDQGSEIAVDANGHAYVTGTTDSVDFPTQGPFQGGLAGFQDAFVTKLDATGSARVYSTYLGGSGFDNGLGIAVDTGGSAYVTGLTTSENFPTQDPVQTNLVGDDAFVTKLDAAGSALVFSTYLGGNGSDQGNAIAVDTTGSAYVTGSTGSGDFPIQGAVQNTAPGNGDAFVTKFGNTPTGANVTIQLGPVTVTFANVTAAGDTTITTSAEGPAPPAGFTLGNPPTYYDVTTTAQFSGSVMICIDFTDIAFGNVASLGLFQFGNPDWVNVTVTAPPPPVKTICGTVTSLSPFAILEAANQAFATFKPEVEIKLPRGANNDSFEVEAFFTLGAGAGIAPLTEDLTLKVGPYSTTIPAGSFKEKKRGFKFKGVIDGVRVAARIQPRARGGFKFEAEGRCADLTGTVNPVTVELTIGEDVGSATVKADISSRSEGRKCGDRRDDDKDDKHFKDDDDD